MSSKITHHYDPGDNRFFKAATQADTTFFLKGQVEAGKKPNGLELKKQFNAAINLYSTVSSTGFKACGEEGSGSEVTCAHP